MPGTGQDAEAEQNEAVHAGGAEKNAESEKYEKEGNLEKFKTENRESFKEGRPDSEEARKSYRKGEGRKKDAEMSCDSKKGSVHLQETLRRVSGERGIFLCPDGRKQKRSQIPGGSFDFHESRTGEILSGESSVLCDGRKFPENDQKL